MENNALKRLPHNEKISLTLPNNLAYIPFTLHFVENILIAHGFDNETCNIIIMATEEAMVNVIQHAFNDNETATYNLTISPLNTGVEISISDKGLPYDPKNIQFNDENLSGLGSFVIGKLMDKVIYNNLGKGGKELILQKFFPSSSALQDLENIEIKPENVVSDYTYTYRLFEAKDAIEVARCAYEAYGYTYSYEHIYFPERVVALNQSGDLISFVAVANTGEIAGHVAMVKFEGTTGLFEIGIAMTKQKFRGGKIFGHLMHFVLDYADEMKINSVFGQCVTTHTYSQSEPIKLGMLPTALMPSYIPDDISFKKIAEQHKKRTAIMIVTKFIEARRDQITYLPQKYLDIVKTIYNQYNIEINLVSEVENMKVESNSISKMSLNTNLQMGKIFFTTLGEDFIPHLKKHIQNIKKENVQMVEAFVNLTQPEAIEMINQAEMLGFNFSGILPGAQEGDFAILQYLNGLDANTDAIKVLEQGQPLLNFIQNQFD